jgi:hypothetical protein
MSDIGIANKLRKICLALDGVEETETFGHPTFRVSAKTFCVLDEYKGESAIAVKVGLPVQGVFLKDPRFYKTPYTGQLSADGPPLQRGGPVSETSSVTALKPSGCGTSRSAH